MIFEEEIESYLNLIQEINEDKIEEIKNFNHRGEYYKIKKYIDDYLNNIDGTERFIVMPGLRGVGKTTILLQLYDYLKNRKKISKNNILYLSMDDIVGNFNINLLKIVDYYLNLKHKVNKAFLKEKIFIFVDESHFDKNWAISGKIIYDNTKNIFLICTGSSAIDLEINGDVARRSLKEPIYPNNFRDYLNLKYNINTDYNFSKSLENIIYFGEEKYVQKAIHLEQKIEEKLYNTKNYPQNIFNEFLKTHGFPISLNIDDKRAYSKIFSLIKKVIEVDIPSIKSFNSSTKVNIRRILIYIAVLRSELVSTHKIANYLSMSPRQVKDILDVLEETQIIFNVKPYGGAGTIIKKPWKYYFLSSSLKSSINYDIGRFNLNNKKCLGILAENYVASTLFKMNQTSYPFMGLFYPPEKKAPDFLLRTKLDDIVPIEVGIGKKTKSQLTRAINKYNSEYGILISNRFKSIRQHNDIIHIPLVSFGFL